MLRLSRAQLREVDRIAIEEYGLPGIVLMENAARSATDILLAHDPKLADKIVAILCGHGNNGGDGYALARHLDNLGCQVVLVEDREATGDAAVFRAVTQKMKLSPINVREIGSLHDGWVDLWVDAIFGTGLSRPPASPMREAIDAMNRSRLPVIALDIPSGLDCDTGEPLSDVCVRATKTITFVAEKTGFANLRSREFTGEIVVGDIGVPREILSRVSSVA